MCHSNSKPISSSLYINIPGGTPASTPLGTPVAPSASVSASASASAIVCARLGPSLHSPLLRLGPSLGPSVLLHVRPAPFSLLHVRLCCPLRRSARFSPSLRPPAAHLLPASSPHDGYRRRRRAGRDACERSAQHFRILAARSVHGSHSAGAGGRGSAGAAGRRHFQRKGSAGRSRGGRAGRRRRRRRGRGRGGGGSTGADGGDHVYAAVPPRKLLANVADVVLCGGSILDSNVPQRKAERAEDEGNTPGGCDGAGRGERALCRRERRSIPTPNIRIAWRSDPARARITRNRS